MSKSSFDIATSARQLAGALMDITDVNGEVDEQAYDAWLAELETTSADIKAKLQSLRAVRSRLLAESETLKTEAARIATMSKRRASDAVRVRGYMKNLLMAHEDANPGQSRVDCEDGHVRLAKRTSLKVELGELWSPCDYTSPFLIDQPPKLDKASVKAAVKNGTHTIEGLGAAGLIVTKSEDFHVVEGK
tara:strand:+ start:3476 stop:4045 length:570 start_codon:yes stop_codon:yes gene_type:complete